MTPAQLAQLALEYWRASGVRSIPRLQALIAAFADTYVLDMPSRETAYTIAVSKVHDWELAK